MLSQAAAGCENEAFEELRAQVEVERELAARLREASDRRGLYSAVYDEFDRRVPKPPEDGADAQWVLSQQQLLLEPFLVSRPRFLEVGGGNGLLAAELRRRLPRVIVVDAHARTPEVIVCDTPPYPLPDGCVDLAFSSHTIEHLVDEDALLHLREMRRLLAPGGRYICVTPNRLWGPHDVSKHFSDVAAGLHLREYTHGELIGLMKKAGFRRCRVMGPHVKTVLLERLIASLPRTLGRRALEVLSIGRQAPLRLFEQVMATGSVD
jgi:SAM-dependent methyltransferase